MSAPVIFGLVFGPMIAGIVGLSLAGPVSDGIMFAVALATCSPYFCFLWVTRA